MGCLGCLAGPICTGLLLMISVWGIFFLGGVGGLFYNQSMGLMADLPPESDEEKRADWSERVPKIEQLYRDNGRNCLIAAAAYVVVFLYSAVRMFFIARN
uniref:Ribonuclease kappa n=1 Tax=Panagrellus redivivus TaxID=6233 RepID=A0A7E4V8Y5_PANRE